MKIVYGKTTFRNALLRSVICILAGIALIMWNEIALKSIVMFIGALFFVSGIMAFFVSYRKMRESADSGALLPFNGVGSMLLGLLLVLAPLFFTTILMYVLGALFILAAIAQLATIFSARQFGFRSGISYLFPVLILIAGILVFFNPWKSAVTVITILGAMAIYYGVTDLIGQYYIHKLYKKYNHPDENGEQNIEDAEYEEVE